MNQSLLIAENLTGSYQARSIIHQLNLQLDRSQVERAMILTQVIEFSTSIVDRIEVLPGGGSTLSGSDAPKHLL